MITKKGKVKINFGTLRQMEYIHWWERQSFIYTDIKTVQKVLRAISKKQKYTCIIILKVCVCVWWELCACAWVYLKENKKYLLIKIIPDAASVLTSPLFHHCPPLCHAAPHLEKRKKKKEKEWKEKKIWWGVCPDSTVRDRVLILFLDY